MDDFKDKQPTCENLAMVIWNIIQPEIAKKTDAKLHQVRIYESPRMYVDYFGN